MEVIRDTARLTFRNWRSDNFELARALWGDAAVMRLLGGPLDDDAVQARLAAEVASQANRGIQYWPIFLTSTGDHIGCCGLRTRDDIIELGFHLRPEFWGAGFAFEAAAAVRDHAFGRLEHEAIFAGHHPEK